MVGDVVVGGGGGDGGGSRGAVAVAVAAVVAGVASCRRMQVDLTLPWQTQQGGFNSVEERRKGANMENAIVTWQKVVSLQLSWHCPTICFLHGRADACCFGEPLQLVK